MNPKTRRAALQAIAAIAILASINALAHSYAGLYQWAIHHRITGWQAATWPAEIDVFLIIGELALYIAYLDAWSGRHKFWPWATALLGLVVSVAGNVGHLPAAAGNPVLVVDRLTAAASPLAAFAGLAIALLVLKQTRPNPPRPSSRPSPSESATSALDARRGTFRFPAVTATVPMQFRATATAAEPTTRPPVLLPADSEPLPDGEARIVQDARELRVEYEQRGARLTRRQLAAQLRARGHTLANARIRDLADAIDLP